MKAKKNYESRGFKAAKRKQTVRIKPVQYSTDWQKISLLRNSIKASTDWSKATQEQIENFQIVEEHFQYWLSLFEYKRLKVKSKGEFKLVEPSPPLVEIDWSLYK